MARTRFGSLDGIHRIKKVSSAESTIISALLFIAILVLFLVGVSRASKGSTDEQLKVLEEAIDRGVTQCYVTEGRYPESFEYLAENYGIIYDEDMFRVDYTIFGSNMRPEIHIICLED